MASGLVTRHVPRVMVARKNSLGFLFISIAEGDFRSTVVIWPDEIPELLEVVRDEGPREFTASY